MNTMHPRVDETTHESAACSFCVVDGGREEALLHGFLIATVAAREAKTLPACFEHRVRLSFVIDLHERIGAELFGKKLGDVTDEDRFLAKPGV